MRRRSTRSSGFTVPEITLTPLIDTALTLLIIFMIASPMMRLTIRVDLPESKGKSSTIVQDEAIVVDVDHAGKLYLNGRIMSLAEIQKAIRLSVQHNPRNNIVYINGDRNLKYQGIVDLIDALNTIDGIQHVALVTQKTSQ